MSISHINLPDKAYRHGDIENVLSEVAKTSVSPLGSSGGSVFGLAQVLLSAERGSSNFTSDDVKRVYFVSYSTAKIICAG